VMGLVDVRKKVAHVRSNKEGIMCLSEEYGMEFRRRFNGGGVWASGCVPIIEEGCHGRRIRVCLF